jgi:uncharacterized protein YceH (UPF0502 family)
MPLDLDPLEQRILGVLIEKELSVPDAYPLTLHALVAGCNQRSNRDPAMSATEAEVAGALRALMGRGWVSELGLAGARVRRYAHEATVQLGVDRPDLALLAELLCRGPQTPAELRARCARMQGVGASPDDVERRLEGLAARAVPYAERLPRRPREHAARWAHRLGAARASPAADPAPTPAPTPRAATGARPEPADPLAALEARVAALERRLDHLGA